MKNARKQSACVNTMHLSCIEIEHKPSSPCKRELELHLMSSLHCSCIHENPFTVLWKDSFIMLMEDDIHFIHDSLQPTSEQTSTAQHMCTALLDVHQSFYALPPPTEVQDLHGIVDITKQKMMQWTAP